jgi:hypothetical protein
MFNTQLCDQENFAQATIDGDTAAFRTAAGQRADNIPRQSAEDRQQHEADDLIQISLRLQF